MKKTTFKRIFFFLLAFAIMFPLSYTKTKISEKNLNSIENDLYEEKLINDIMDRYVKGDSSLNIIKDENGNEKIIVNDKITITKVRRIHSSSNTDSLNKSAKTENISYNGKVIKSAIKLSDGVFSQKDRAQNMIITASGSFSYEISGFGLTFGLFKSNLGDSIVKTYSQNSNIEYTVNKNKLAAVYGVRVYDGYEYKGWIRKGTLLSPSYFDMFIVER